MVLSWLDPIIRKVRLLIIFSDSEEGHYVRGLCFLLASSVSWGPKPSVVIAVAFI